MVASNAGCGRVSSPTAVTIASCVTNDITTGNVSATYCPGGAVSVNFVATGTYTGGNVYTAQLSDASGNFASPVTVGTLTSTSNGVLTINANPGIIPIAAAAGTGYKIRVISSSPAITGSANNDFEILGPAPTISVTSPSGGCAPGTVDITAIGVVTVTNGATVSGITYCWSRAKYFKIIICRTCNSRAA